MTRRAARGIALRDAMRETRSWWIRSTGGDYQLIRDLGGGDFLSYDLRVIASGIPGPYLNLHQLGFARVGVPMLSVDEQFATLSGTWTYGATSGATVGYAPKVISNVSVSGTAITFPAGTALLQNERTRRLDIPGAGAGGTVLTTTMTVIAGDGNSATLAAAASVAVSGVTVTLYPYVRYSVLAGSTLTWVSPAGTTSLGIRTVTTPNGGLGKVTIDGDATLANLLPTAQSRVDAAIYPNTILVANGGTLNPTDRVLDCYASGSTTWDAPLAIATGLTAGAHTIVVTATGFTATGATGNRTYVSGLSYATTAVDPATTGAEVLATAQWQTGVSAHEYAYRYVPATDGAGNPLTYGTIPIAYYGRVHGYDDEQTLTMTNGGSPLTLTDGQTAAVSGKLVITQTSNLHHPDTTALMATITTIYTLDGDGLTVEHTCTWQAAGTLYGGYAAMLPAASIFDRYTNSGLWKRLTVNAGDGSHVGDGAAWIAVGWTSSGRYAESLELVQGLGPMGTGRQNPTLDRAWYEDRAASSGVKINKHYVPWTADPVTPQAITAGNVWHSQFRYRFRRFPTSAEAVLGVL